MPKLGLKYFMLAQQSLALYRQFNKAIVKIPDERTREEIRTQVRDEFEKHRRVEDEKKMEYLIVTGKKQLSTLVALSANYHWLLLDCLLITTNYQAMISFLLSFTQLLVLLL